MKKPRLFIGSSVEGLNIAYAIQENLNYNAEITVWSQGVFDLSDTTIESLMTVVENSDFGVFVFTPDDITTMRGKKNQTVRDNVLFELGLFIGKIGRKRSFIVMPDNSEINLPTDLLGINPGKYEASRSDENLKAGTGSVSNKIREAINKLGHITAPESESDTTKPDKVDTGQKTEKWYEEIFIKKNYPEAIRLLKTKIKSAKTEDVKLKFETFICHCHVQLNYQNGIGEFRKLIEKFPTNTIAYQAFAKTLMDNNNFSDALLIIEEGLLKCEKKIKLILMKADCYWQTLKKDQAIDILKKAEPHPLITVKLASYYTENKDFPSALDLLKESYKTNPRDENILTKFARIAIESEDYELSTLLYTTLVQINPDSASDWCMLGNSYYHMDLNNAALNAYEKANSLSQGKQAWIHENIGNLYKSIGLFSKAIESLLKSNDIYDKSDYTLDRLSESYKSIEQENKKISEITSNAISKIQASLPDLV